MGQIIGLAIGVILISTFAAGLYLLLRHFHRRWKWQDQVNENTIRRAILEEADVQFEVAPDGFIRPVPRGQRGHSTHIN